MNDIILFWIQGSWKSTLAKMIMDYNANYGHFEMWNILRTLKKTDNVLGNYVKDIIDQWWLVHYSFVNALFDAYMITLKHDELMLLDGFPRRLWEMFFFLDKMQRYKRDFVVLFLDLPSDEAVRRLSSRRICKSCWTIFNVNNYSQSHCNLCGWELIQRNDDQPEAIKKRIELFFQETQPVIDYFEKMWALHKIDATKTPEEVFDEVKKCLELSKWDIHQIEESIISK